MINRDLSKFSSAIPGESLTTELGARPWETPPKYSTPNEALEYYLQKLREPDTTAHMLQILESGYPITDLVDAIVLGGVMQGLHTIDVAVLISPIIFELIKTVAESTDTDYKDGVAQQEKTPKAAVMELASRQSSENGQLEISETDQLETSDNDELNRLTEAVESQGLMARELGPINEEERV